MMISEDAREAFKDIAWIITALYFKIFRCYLVNYNLFKKAANSLLNTVSCGKIGINFLLYNPQTVQAILCHPWKGPITSQRSTKNKCQPKTNVNQKQMSTKNKCQPKTKQINSTQLNSTQWLSHWSNLALFLLTFACSYPVWCRYFDYSAYLAWLWYPGFMFD